MKEEIEENLAEEASKIGNRLFKKFYFLGWSDLVQTVALGLCEADKKFKESGGTKSKKQFRYYCIANNIRDATRSHNRFYKINHVLSHLMVGENDSFIEKIDPKPTYNEVKNARKFAAYIKEKRKETIK